MRKELNLLPVVCLLLCGLANAQTELERFERQLEQIRRETRVQPSADVPLGQRTYLDYGAYTTLNYLSLDDSDLKDHGLRQYDLVAYAQMNIDAVHEFFVRGRAFYRDFNQGAEFDDDGDGWDGRLERAFYRFNWSRYMAATAGAQGEGNLAVKAGRDLNYWANGLVLSQELDGVVVDLSRGQVALQLVAGITPLDTFDIDSTRPNFDGNTKRGFYGAILSTRRGNHRPFVYALLQEDYNTDDTLDDPDSGITTEFDYNSYYIGIGSTGALSDRVAYGVELVYEGGDTLSNSYTRDSAGGVSEVPQERDDISAWAADVQLDYLVPDQRNTRFSAELILASGDSDRERTSSTFGGNEPGTTDHAFNSFGLLNTGLAFGAVPSNLISLRGGVSTFPLPNERMFRRMQVGADFFVFAKLNESAPIDETTSDDRMLGYEPDLYLNWQITSDVTLAIRYGVFIPGEAIAEDDKVRQFFYTGVTFAY